MRSLFRNADFLFVCLFMIGLALTLAFLPNPTALDDSLRHLAMGRMMMERGVTHSYWNGFLFWGTMSGLRTDPWFLYDVLIMQFARFPDLLALDLNVFFSVSALALAGFAALRSLGLKGVAAAVFLWMLLMGDQQFFARMMIGRPFTLQTALAVGVIACVWNRNYVLLGVLIALSVLVSQLFVFPLFFSIAGIFWTTIARSKHDAVHLSVCTVIGLFIGFALHPFALQYLEYIATVFLQIPFLTEKVTLSKEMHLSFADISMTGVLVAIAFIILLITTMLRKKKSWIVLLRSEASYPLLLSVILFPVYLVWVRAIDVLWPVLILSIASLFLLVRKDVTALLAPAFKNTALRAIMIVLVICQSIALPAWFFLFDNTRNITDFSAASMIPDHAKVLDLDWTQFPVLALLQPHARYATGIDPSFLYLTQPRVYRAFSALQDERLTDDRIDGLLRYLFRESDACIVVIPASWPARVHSALERMPKMKVMEETRAIVVYQHSGCAND